MKLRERPLRSRSAFIAKLSRRRKPQAKRASNVIGIALSAAETGQISLALAAISLNLASSMPGTVPLTVSALPRISKPPPCFGWRSISALTSSDSAGVPPSASMWASCMEKHAACAAAISSSGFVPDRPVSSSKRALKLKGKPPRAPLWVLSSRPEPLVREPFQITLAWRFIPVSPWVRLFAGSYGFASQQPGRGTGKPGRLTDEEILHARHAIDQSKANVADRPNRGEVVREEAVQHVRRDAHLHRVETPPA